MQAAFCGCAQLQRNIRIICRRGSNVLSARNMQKLNCTAQSYGWGKFGRSSLVANFKEALDKEFEVQESSPYAELWMGTHPNGPSRVIDENTSLAEYIKAHPSVIGRVPAGYTADDLPFLFKVLSIRTALSIQSHPDKQLAMRLFESQPHIYKDGNHKPEMAIALTDFEALCGFRSLSEISHHLKSYPELRNMIGEEAVAQFEAAPSADALKQLFHHFIHCTAEITTLQVTSLISRLSSQSTRSALDNLILRLQDQYPNDRGVLTPLLLNFLQLRPGEAFFMGPNELHAYLSGDCVECMALSDNTVRAGLTPKFVDVDTLCSMLTCQSKDITTTMLHPQKLDHCATLYRPPGDICAEFEVEQVSLPAATEYCLAVQPCASVLIVVNGHCTLTDGQKECTVSAGSVLFVPSNVSVKATTSESACDCYRAHINMQDA